MRRVTPLCLILCLSGMVSGADLPEKKPWAWEIDQRLAVRLDPEDTKRRQVQYETDYPQSKAAKGGRRVESNASNGAGQVSGRVWIDTVDGRRNPELLFPHELFKGLLTTMQPDERLRTLQRQFYGPDLRARAIDEEQFWSRLEAITSNYVALKYQAANGSAKGTDRWIAECRALHGALLSARNTFGGFDQLLYEVVAPSYSTSTTTDTDLGKRLRQEVRGCE